jgi:hypothetical protein
MQFFYMIIYIYYYVFNYIIYYHYYHYYLASKNVHFFLKNFFANINTNKTVIV